MAFRWVLAIVETEPVSDPNAAALYAAVSAVLVALIGGVVAVLTTRVRAQVQVPPPVAMDEMASTHALPRELADMLVEVIAERDMWRNRAVRLGWPEEKL